MTRILTSLAVAALLVACSQKTATPQQAEAPTPGVKAAIAAAEKANAPAAAQASAITGKVAETLDGGGYTYVRLETATGDVWAAIPKANLEVGKTATVYGQMTMQNWQSETLKRKFDSVVFATLDAPAPAGSASGMAAMMGGHGQEAQQQVADKVSNSPQDHMAAPDAGPINVPKAEGGKTVAEIWAAKASMKDAPVVVRGRVVKSLSGIMGKNWIHVRDGSGSRADGTDDITITTDQAAPKVGDVVLVKGVVRIDKDFGSGYVYPMIIENAKLQ
ncbi:MAG: OB-fold nucleic acid binding domain-containing protein [Thermoanaerobaculia bacterium]